MQLVLQPNQLKSQFHMSPCPQDLTLENKVKSKKEEERQAMINTPEKLNSQQ